MTIGIIEILKELMMSAINKDYIETGEPFKELNGSFHKCKFRE